MSKQQRFGLVALALVVAVVAFIIARPEGDDEPAGQAATTPAQTETAPAQAGPEEAEAPAQTETTPAKPKPEVTRVRVRGGEPVGGAKEITVKKGDTVRFDVHSDTADEVHVHGYDLLEEVGPGKPARFRFKADIEGIFEVELHHTEALLVELRVEP